MKKHEKDWRFIEVATKGIWSVPEGLIERLDAIQTLEECGDFLRKKYGNRYYVVVSSCYVAIHKIYRRFWLFGGDKVQAKCSLYIAQVGRGK